MNSRINSDDHELPTSTRLSARSRFSPPPAAAFASPALSVSSVNTTSKSKGGINGRTYEDDDELQLGGGLSASRSAMRSAAKHSTSNSSQHNGNTADDFRSLTRQGTNGSTASSAKERPWRTANSSSSTITNTSAASSYATANTHTHNDYDLDNRTRSNDSTDSLGQQQQQQQQSAVTTPTRNRWAQYETDDLAEESRKATSNAVVDMATRLANETQEEEMMIEKQPMIIMGGDVGSGYNGNDDDGYGVEVSSEELPPRMKMPADNMNSNSSSRSTKDYVKSRLSSLVTTQRTNNNYEQRSLSNSSSIQSDHDKVRSEALKMLQMADSCLQDSPRNNNASSSSSSASTTSPTTGLFRTTGGGLAMRELHNEEVNSISVKREKTSSIAGIDKFQSEKTSPSRHSGYDGTFSIGSRSNDDKEYGEPHNNDDAQPSSSWSSRYSVERQLMAITGGLDSTHMLAKMDMLHTSRQKTKSARGLYRASGYAMDGSHEEYNDYTTNSSSGGVYGMGNNMWLWLKGTLWSDDLELNYDGTTQSLVRREKAMRKRRRLRMGLGLLVGLSVAIGVLVHVGNPNKKKSTTMSSQKDVHFYVLADEPYDFSNVELLTRELEALPKDAEFVIHLGNANGDKQSRCQEYGFERAAAVLKESPVPVLVIPGDLDWAACGTKEDAERALNWWDVSLGQTLTKSWDDSPLDVDYFESVVGNFAFLHKGVLFISVNIVDAETEPNEVTRRLEQNVMWTKEKLTQFGAGEYHALVIFGHAPPSSKQGEYFWPVVERIKDLNKPVLYLHANSNGSFEQYTPFNEAENFKAVQLEKRGVEAPMRVVVMAQEREEGNDYDGTFMFERREPTLERIEE
mmetsp:Transcript_21566/g.46907  ORF Transcript_21566/g.46907 Transcript_21566/m.46907 type:complete len:855 (-) Transcript_21566:208-2772(-)|eukprot:CAMPEP_0172318642 /NCGR_PEP_ID=MMETSP1058-20130122/35465_1 /TAXON_ID=83371 /ORGANISM="Detonula confervacea, Strain CCMP 353" /LENGTH=854 /DNA_ID=CAMNT_0013033519 /DNA_START=27 /DNA_END=2591 /DNA_ORIENTATION=-